LPKLSQGDNRYASGVARVETSLEELEEKAPPNRQTQEPRRGPGEFRALECQEEAVVENMFRCPLWRPVRALTMWSLMSASSSVLIVSSSADKLELDS
jgi:hypothetical protein